LKPHKNENGWACFETLRGQTKLSHRSQNWGLHPTGLVPKISDSGKIPNLIAKPVTTRTSGYYALQILRGGPDHLSGIEVKIDASIPVRQPEVILTMPSTQLK